jgi:hypothetical protein
MKLCLTLRNEQRLRMFENVVLKRIFGSKGRWLETGENCITRSFMTCTFQLFG